MTIQIQESKEIIKSLIPYLHNNDVKNFVRSQLRYIPFDERNFLNPSMWKNIGYYDGKRWHRYCHINSQYTKGLEHNTFNSINLNQIINDEIPTQYNPQTGLKVLTQTNRGLVENWIERGKLNAVLLDNNRNFAFFSSLAISLINETELFTQIRINDTVKNIAIASFDKQIPPVQLFSIKGIHAIDGRYIFNLYEQNDLYNNSLDDIDLLYIDLILDHLVLRQSPDAMIASSIWGRQEVQGLMYFLRDFAKLHDIAILVNCGSTLEWDEPQVYESCTTVATIQEFRTKNHQVNCIFCIRKPMEWDLINQKIRLNVDINEEYQLNVFHADNSIKRLIDNEGKEFVYFIHENDTNHYKIGKSSKPEKRVGQLQTGNPRGLQIPYILPTYDMSLLESELHEHFKERHLKGEWFALRNDDINFIKSICPERPIFNSLDGRRFSLAWELAFSHIKKFGVIDELALANELNMHLGVQYPSRKYQTGRKELKFWEKEANNILQEMVRQSYLVQDSDGWYRES
ncbi:MAG: GIY-YIG nuclease family protein [Chloroflexota bacterium]